jgi:hypothetical protein
MATRPVIDAGSISHAVLATGTPWDTTISVTVALNPKRCLFVFLKTYDVGNVNSVTYNGTALTKSVDNAAAAVHGTQIWTLLGDANVSVGTYNLVIDATSNEFGEAYVACFYNVSTLSGANTNQATSASATVAVQTDVDSVSIMGVGSGNGGRTHTPVETVIGAWINGAQSGACSYFNGDGSNKTMTDNLSGSDGWRACGLNLKGENYGSSWNPSPVLGLMELWERTKRRTKLYQDLKAKGAIPLGMPI